MCGNRMGVHLGRKVLLDGRRLGPKGRVLEVDALSRNFCDLQFCWYPHWAWRWGERAWEEMMGGMDELPWISGPCESSFWAFLLCRLWFSNIFHMLQKLEDCLISQSSQKF